MLRLWSILACVAVLAVPSPAAAGILDLEEPRMQWVERNHASEDWPFLERRGVIVCMRLMKMRHPFFVPETQVKAAENEDVFLNSDPNAFVHLSTYVTDILTQNRAFGTIFIPFDSFEAHIRRIAPFVAIGKSLCDQPEGAVIGPGDL